MYSGSRTRSETVDSLVDKFKRLTVTKMRSSGRKAILSVIIAVVISDAVAKPPSAIKQSTYIGPDDYSFVARIAFYGGGGTCAGAIISPRHIITAASCLYDKTGGRVYTGIQHGPNETAIVNGINQGFVVNFSMPTDGQDVRNDIGIVSLHTDLVFNLRQRNIGLPNTQAEHLIAWVAGWEPASGEGNVPLNFKKTQINLRSGQLCLNSGNDDTKAQNFCGYQEDPTLCLGETGSPVVSNGILYAIVSVDTCNGSSDRRYTNVFHHIDWIKRTIAA